MKTSEDLSQKKIEQLNWKIGDFQKQIDSLNQEKKDLSETYQTKMQAFIKDKEDLATAFQHVEGKLQKVEMDREQLKLLSNQQKEQLEAHTTLLKELEGKLSVRAKDNETLKEELKKLEANLENSKKNAADKMSQSEE